MNSHFQDYSKLNIFTGIIGVLVAFSAFLFVGGTEVACIDHQPSYSLTGLDGFQVSWTDGCNYFSTSWAPIAIGGLLILFATRKYVEKTYENIRGGNRL
jgi:hypothetical protein